MNISVEVRKWGNSMGVLIPKDVAKKLHFNVGDKVILDVQKRGTILKELFGSLPFTKPSDKILAEVRGELEGKWM